MHVWGVHVCVCMHVYVSADACGHMRNITAFHLVSEALSLTALGACHSVRLAGPGSS